MTSGNSSKVADVVHRGDVAVTARRPNAEPHGQGGVRRRPKASSAEGLDIQQEAAGGLQVSSCRSSELLQVR